MASLGASRFLLLLSLFITSILCIPNPKSDWVTAARSRSRGHLNNNPKRFMNNTCFSAGTSSISAPKSNIWLGLTDDEAASVVSWLFAQKDLNLTVSTKATEWDNTVLLVELQHPNKSDALAYVDGNSSSPARYAHVVLDVRATEDPTYSDILVGPLPIKNGTITWQPLEYPYTRKTAGKVRNLDADEDLRSAWVANITGQITDITIDLWGGYSNGSANDTLSVWGIDPMWQEDGRIIDWRGFWNKPVDSFDTGTLEPLGLYLKLDVTGRDPSKWSVEGWLYNDIFYATTEAFRTAYWSPGFEKLGGNFEGDWARTDHYGPAPGFDTYSPPVMALPGGSRYAVDQEAQYVEWMDFSFYISFTRERGLALYDIAYKGQRILYELGLQEALAHYAGKDPVQSGTSYLDSFYGFGPYAFELVPGYDCPAYSAFLNSSFYVAETTHTHLNSICLFEYDADYPIQRHSTSNYVSNTKNVYFTVRSVSTVGNYDYMFSYQFFMDGSIKVEVRASGYIQSAFYAHNSEYGYQIHDALSGSMHDHVLNFKADFDILGTANTLETTTNVAVSEVYPWSEGKARNTMKLQRAVVASEDQSRINYDANGATQYTIINTDKPNEYGMARGYRFHPSSPTIHLTVENSSNLDKAATWSSTDFAVTKQKDTEPRSAHAYNSQDVANPPVNFDAFFDSESLLQEDLVLWFNLGMHHVPHTGDLPNTVFTTAQSSVVFSPVNYFDGDESRKTVNMVRVEYGNGSVSEVEMFGQKEVQCEVEVTEPDLESYKGDVVIRKFPYDPNEPYYETRSIE